MNLGIVFSITMLYRRGCDIEWAVSREVMTFSLYSSMDTSVSGSMYTGRSSMLDRRGCDIERTVSRDIQEEI